MKTNHLASFIHGFLQDFLIVQKGFSPHTVLSYRDTIKMFLVFAATRNKKSVTNLTLSDLSPAISVKFLDHLETKRGNSRQTRNNRLACLHSFFRYVAGHDPRAFEQCQRILIIPFKRTKSSPIEYLERKEVKAILEAVDRTTQNGYRDYTLFSFMYNTGARVDETVRLTPRSFQLQRPFQVRFSGKGAKERLCPLWPETVKLLRALFRQKGLDAQSNSPVFTNRRGEALTRHGVRYLLNKYVKIATTNCPSLKEKCIHPHSIRHATAMHMLQAGVDINSIRAWLGHANLKTTNRYAEHDLEMKRKLLEKYLPSSKAYRPWKKNRDILEWLESL